MFLVARGEGLGGGLPPGFLFTVESRPFPWAYQRSADPTWAAECLLSDGEAWVRIRPRGFPR